MKRIISLTALLVLISAWAFADIARPDKTPTPKPVKTIDTVMDISLQSDAKVARLIIPKSQVKQLRAELERLDDDADNTAAVTAPGAFTRTQTIVSGMFLSLALVFGGIWFVRSGKTAPRTGKAFVVLAGLAVIGSAATLVYANIGPPQAARSITGKMFSQAVHSQGFGWGTVRLEVGSVGDRVQLIVPNPNSTAGLNDDE